MSNDHTNIILEEMNSKFDAVVEAVGQMQDDIKTLAKQADLDEIKADIKIVKAAVVDHSNHINDHEKRVTRLESAKSHR
jgi:hypothetical protein